MAIMLRAVLLTMAALTVEAQTLPSFEVASVKPNTSADSRGARIQFLSGGRFIATNYPLLLTISAAWNLSYQSPRLSGGPDWIRSARYDIEAKGSIPAGLPGPAQKARMRSMLQALLIDRFKLTVSRDTKELPVFAVLIAKNGPKLEKSKIEEKDCGDQAQCHTFTGGRGRGLHGQAVDMSDLAIYVENWAERPVIDRTGIKGLFHIETSGWLPMTPGPVPAAGLKAEDGTDYADLPTLFAIFEQMGLKLEPQKAPIDVFHIERVEKPAEN